MRAVALSLLGLGFCGLVLPVFDVEVVALPYLGLALVLAGAGLFVFIGVEDPEGFGDPRAWRRFRRNKGGLAGCVLLLFVASVSFVGPLVAPHDPNQIFDEGLQATGTPTEPNPLFWLGADHLGRDQLSRLLFGGRVSLAVALGAALIAGTFGFCSGLISGYYKGRTDGLYIPRVGTISRGWVDPLIIQLINYVLSLPFLLVAILVNQIIDDPSLAVLSVLLGALSWTRLARVTRAKTLQVRELQYVEAARALGMSDARIIFRHIVPNVIGPAIVIITTLIAILIIVESAMSFLGFGVKPPTASWGSMLRDGQEYMAYAPRLLLWPAALIVATVFGFNLVGEGLRDALDPKE